MNKLIALLLLSPALALAAITATVTPGDWPLYRGSTIVSRHATLDACVEAAKALAVTRSYTCRTSAGVAVTVTVDPPPPPPPPPTGGPTFTISKDAYVGDDYVTAVWSGVAPCVASSDPAYAPWSGDQGASGARSLSPDYSVVLTLSCANGTVSRTLTVTGFDTPPPPTGGGGGTPPPPPTETLPVPPVLATPIALPVAQLPANDPARNFSQTARRNWNFGGHSVPVPFDSGQGYWVYEPCTGDYPTWLFDRPSAWFKYAELTGEQSALDLAISDFRYWVGKINAQGYFSCKTGEQDSKYLYIEPFVRYEAATGDTQYRAVADRVYAQSAAGFPSNYSTSIGLWTEREVGIHLGAALDYYRLTGNTQALARAAALVRHWDAVAGAVGAPLVTYTRHEGGGPGGTQPTSLTNSPWMSAMYFQAARRYWQITGDENVLRQASAYFDWLDVNGLYDGSLAHPELTGVTMPRYLTGELIGDAGYGETDLMHCPDVEGFVAFAVDAKRRLGLPTARAEQRKTEMSGCTARLWANWTRTTTTLPRYRIQNPRAWNWWVGGLYESAR